MRGAPGASYRTRRTGGTPNKETVDYLFDKHNGECVYCGDYAAVLDHVNPHRNRGRGTRDNLVPACQKCNGAASDWVFDTFDEKKRYVLLARFSNKEHAVNFREQCGSYRASCPPCSYGDA